MYKHGVSRFLLVLLIPVLFVPGVLILLEVSLWVILAALALTLAGVYFFLINVLRIKTALLSKTTREIASGDHGLRFDASGIQEFDSLGKDLNEMLEELNSTIDHLAVHREELRLVLSSIEDALWSMDYKGRIQWANERFGELFPAYEPDGSQQYWEVIREPALLEKIKEAEGEGKNLISEISFAAHDYMLSVSRNDKSQRKVFILHNIDVIQQAARMKKDFIINLAHELRTPLTAIKGYTEAMRDAPGIDHTRYLKIIVNHANRLIHLIRDLEQLIRLEGTSDLETKDINLETFFENIRLILEPEIEEKQLYLRIELDPACPRLTCDPFRFEQVFINLVQNSLRYTDSGGITIRSSKAGDHLRFEVSDTGRGISAEHLPRIFERFYVADPSRNKSQSGTGLGLAIIKHIVLLHKGTISVDSKLGEGTVFRIDMPLRAEMGESRIGQNR
ncbi:MAG: HAMP domain-containing sensor histidine kinase [Candidatus Syntrophosphaera sp.]